MAKCSQCFKRANQSHACPFCHQRPLCLKCTCANCALLEELRLARAVVEEHRDSHKDFTDAGRIDPECCDRCLALAAYDAHVKRGAK